eukprot:CAMPEP_0194357552 /NCGR_PEP_ID=MMETSP0174-20130528/5018_1 /TAXON_ID=216777 /ORGANISM="Proboscia alata, Strain PI-D3" /LENGTH=477 /DNA_ID=CAMNT_0039127627 /DNA_START=33 /DNA_END=1466 /DNA_ORIENTATION=+
MKMVSNTNIHRTNGIPRIPLRILSLSLLITATTVSAMTTPIHISKRGSSMESFKVMDVLQRANELEASGRKILHCEVGQPESGAPANVAKAAITALSGPPRQVMGYTEAFGLPSLRSKIAEHYLKKYKLSGLETRVDTKQIVITTGSSGGFLLLFTACFDAGDTIAVGSSGYPCYRNILGALGCQVATVKLNAEFKFTAVELSLEIARRANAGEEKLKGLILSSPSNPTGAMLNPVELEALCKVCEENGVQFISDEIYHGISYGKEEATALQFSEKAVVINSFSKYYSMSGWRLGWIVIPPALIDPINSLQQNMFINAPTISQTAALQCWEDDTNAELETHVTKYATSRTVILDALRQIPELTCSFLTGEDKPTETDGVVDESKANIAPADGGFYVYIDLGTSNVSEGYGSVAMCQALLEDEGVAFTPGVDFEDPTGVLGDRRVRISYAGGIDTATEAMERFTAFWPKWLAKVRANQ